MRAGFILVQNMKFQLGIDAGLVLPLNERKRDKGRAKAIAGVLVRGLGGVGGVGGTSGGVHVVTTAS